MNHQQVEQRIRDLIAELNEHNHRYYILDDPIISDAGYDQLLRELQELETEFPDLVQDDSPSQRVGSRPQSKFEPLTHTTPMLSLENAMDDQELIDFDRRVRKDLELETLGYVVEPKLDGLGVELIYINGVFTAGSTRGDGFIGENITQNLKTLRSLPLRLRSASRVVPPYLEVRGEVFMAHKDFENLNQRQLADGKSLFANPRNAAAGSLRQLDSRITARRNLQINIYAPGRIDDFEIQTHFEFMQALKDWGLPVNDRYQLCNGIEEVLTVHQNLEQNREALSYDIDGSVTKVNLIAYQEQLGIRSRSPRWAIAGKFKARQEITRIMSIEASVGRTGAVTPVANLEPVPIGGVIVARATLHNQDEIDRKDVREGDTVVVQRAGDVIPEVVKVIMEARDPHSQAYHIPEFCPVCHGHVIRLDGEAKHYCQNISCPAQIKGRIEHFVSKRCLDIDGFGTKLVSQLVDTGLIKSIADIYSLTADQLAGLDRMAEKSAENILQAIENSKSAELWRMLHGLGIRHVGEHLSKVLARKYGSLKGLSEADIEDLEITPEVGPIVARGVKEFFKEEINLNLIVELKGHGLDPVEEVDSTSPGILVGLSFVFTGKLDFLNRDSAREIVESNGGSTSNSISKKTDFLVAGPGAGSKLEKAATLGVKVISEADFRKMVGIDQDHV
ncbi:MAG: NAD-dependent DNA ligase LigA [Candidatus Marinimicrobia bacterium]|nr:NAD-dependent DNA ligase LigA [Candidatus Neomarinimicrobiota bacterium]